MRSLSLKKPQPRRSGRPSWRFMGRSEVFTKTWTACKERGEIEVKGLHYPVRVYEVMEAASPASGLSRPQERSLLHL